MFTAKKWMKKRFSRHISNMRSMEEHYFVSNDRNDNENSNNNNDNNNKDNDINNDGNDNNSFNAS